jgi:putative FmdB family regulatory protein
MPTYEYQCQKCGNTFELLQKMSDKPVSECPKCKGKVKKLISGGTGLIFKGTGFYSTDYKKSSAASSTKSESAHNKGCGCCDKAGTPDCGADKSNQKKG